MNFFNFKLNLLNLFSILKFILIVNLFKNFMLVNCSNNTVNSNITNLIDNNKNNKNNNNNNNYDEIDDYGIDDYLTTSPTLNEDYHDDFSDDIDDYPTLPLGPPILPLGPPILPLGPPLLPLGPPILDNYFNKLRHGPREVAKNIFYRIIRNGRQIFVADGSSTESLKDVGCDLNDNYTIIIHGWREDTKSTEWIPWMVSNFTKYRGGCIIAIDYGVYAEGPYLRLVQNFDLIADAIFKKMKLWKNNGMNLENTLIFGFSYGGQLAVTLGKKLGKQKIGAIDACDLAGPGFDIRDRGEHHRNAAKNVQCIHTSRDKGTRFYDTCHQNWRLGNCGFSQPGAERPPLGSHGLCVYYYLLSFEHNFFARQRPRICPARNEVLRWPDKFKMGYMENRKSEVRGELFVPLSRDAPYIMPYNSNSRSEENDLLLYAQLPSNTAEIIRKFQDKRKRFKNRPVINKFLRARKIFVDRLQRKLKN